MNTHPFTTNWADTTNRKYRIRYRTAFARFANVNRARTWTSALIVGVVLLIAEWAWAQSEQPRWLGVHAAVNGDQWVVTWVQPAGWAWDAGIRPGDVISSVDESSVPADETFYTAHTLRVLSSSGVELVAPATVSPALESFSVRTVFLILALVFGILGALACGLGTNRSLAFALGGFALAVAVMLLAAIATLSGSTAALAAEYLAVTAFGLCTAMVAFAVPNANLGRSTRLSLGCSAAVMSIVVVGLYARALWQDPATYEAMRRVQFIVLTMELAVASFVGIRAVHELVRWHPSARASARLVLYGLLAGVCPFGLLFLVPSALGMQPILAPEFAVISLCLFPVTLAVAVLSRRFESAVRPFGRRLIALWLWSVLLATYAIVVQVSLATNAAADGRAIWPVVLVVGTGAGLLFLQRPLQCCLEYVFFGGLRDYPGALMALGAEVCKRSGIDSILDLCLTRLGETLGVSWAAVLTEAEPNRVYGWSFRGREPLPSALDLLEPMRSPKVEYSAPLIADSMHLGILAVGPQVRELQLSTEDRALVNNVAYLIAPALRTCQLVSALRAQVSRLEEREDELARLYARMIRIQEKERRRLALDIHDDPLQRAILLARRLAERQDLADADLRREAEDVVTALRAICEGLRPSELDDLGLVAGLEFLVNETRTRSEIDVELQVEHVEPCERLDEALEEALYRVAQEALNNCLKHASPTRISVRLRRDGDCVQLRVADDGLGLSSDRELGDNGSHGLGLIGMRERLAPWQGAVALADHPAGGALLSAAVRVSGIAHA